MGEGLPKLIVILGPTASGKTGVSLAMAKKYNGAIISADSRQMYKKMDIGTAKVEGEWQWAFGWKGPQRMYLADGVPHYMVDCVDPGKRFTVAAYRDQALKYIKQIIRMGKVPMLVGGTGLYISAIVDNLQIPRVPPNKKLRESLEEKSLEELFALFENLDPEGAKVIDKKNKRRLIRALEVSIFTGEPFSAQRTKGDPMFDVLQIGMDVPREVLHERISNRVDEMVDKGLIDEITQLLKQKYSWVLPSMSGIGYKQFRKYFEGSESLEDAISHLKRDTRRFARRQRTWFRRDKRIVWCKDREEIDERIEQFLS